MQILPEIKEYPTLIGDNYTDPVAGHTIPSVRLYEKVRNDSYLYLLFGINRGRIITNSIITESVESLSE